jgi:hypothetical protein
MVVTGVDVERGVITVDAADESGDEFPLLDVGGEG